MADREVFARLSDDELGALLTVAGRDLAVPRPAAGASDLASRARLRIESAGIKPDRGVLERLGLASPRRRAAARPIRRSLVLAVIALLAIAAVAGAVGFGLPGLRFVFAPPASQTPSGTPTSSLAPSPSPVATLTPSLLPTPSSTFGPSGFGLGLGEAMTLAEARSRVGFTIRVPADARLGQPDAVWVDAIERVTLVWGARTGVTDTIEDGLALIVSEFPGHLDAGYFEKILQDGTTIEAVRVGDDRGYWISGSSHEFVYVNPSGEPTFDSRRIGDTLAWSTGDVTYRIETTLGRDAAIELARSMR